MVFMQNRDFEIFVLHYVSGTRWMINPVFSGLQNHVENFYEIESFYSIFALNH